MLSKKFNLLLISCLSVLVMSHKHIQAQATYIDEDFSSGASDFTVISGGTWSVSGERYQLTSPGDEGAGLLGNIAVHNTNIIGDFTLTTTLNITGTSSDWNDAAVVFNFQDANNFYYVSLNESNDENTKGIFKVESGVATELSDILATISTDIDYQVNIRKGGIGIFVYLNSLLVATADDATFTGGKIGYGSKNDGLQADNLIVTDLTDPVIPDTEISTNDIISNAEVLYKDMLSTITKDELYPRSEKDGNLRLVKTWDWTSGFFPGSLWYLYEYTQDNFWKQEAEKRTAPIEDQKNNTGTHDLGFMIGCSFGNGYRLTQNNNYKDIIITASNSLISRYDADVGCIRSWDFGSWEFPVIIDNMMNLDMLFEASKLTGDQKYYDIAVKHALTTIDNHFREDNSSYHVVNYNKTTGAVIGKQTHQGYANESAWARGQAWGLYGYTLCYRETQDNRFLEMAEKIAAFYMNDPNLPLDKIPYWDFDDPAIPSAPRDASAAAIAASALFDLAGFSVDNGDTYREFAISTLKSLSSDIYTAKKGENYNFIIKHCTGNKPSNSEVDVPLNYADYYYLEAILKYKKELNENPFVNFNFSIDGAIVDIDASQTTDDDAELTYAWDFGDGNSHTGNSATISHTYNNSGNFTVSLVVSDNWGGSNLHSEEITIHINQPPVLGAVENKELTENQGININISATDADSDPITLSVSNLPSFASFTDNGDGTGVINLQPVAGDAATYSNIIIEASDAEDTDSETITITVNEAPVNQLPVLAAIGNKELTENQEININISATDADSDPITLSVSNLPLFASFTDNGDGTGVINLQPVAGDAATYSNIIIEASDAEDTDSETITITVLNLPTTITAEVHNANVRIYPNPGNTDKLTLEISLEEYEFAGKLQIIDIAGNIVVSENISSFLPSGNNTYHISTENLSNGIFFITVQTNKRTYNNKVVINK